MRFITLEKLDGIAAEYKLLIGQRSNGKTSSCLERVIANKVADGSAGAIIRRWDTDFTHGRGDAMFRSLVQRGVVYDLTEGRWTDIIFKSRRWYFCKFDDELDKIVMDDTPLAYAFSIAGAQHDKSTGYPDVKTVVFDEFLVRPLEYLPDEFIQFSNLLSTIIRERDDVTIYMCGNTISEYAPYFSEMGLYRVKDMRPGEVDVYTYGESNLRVAVYFTDRVTGTKKSEKYFAFNNPKLSMITGKGSIWEFGIHPHCPAKYTKSNVVYRFILEWNGERFLGELVVKERLKWIQFTRKTTPIKDPDTILIYSPKASMQPNRRQNIMRPFSPREKVITGFFARGKVAYQDNQVGEAVTAYIAWCARQ